MLPKKELHCSLQVGLGLVLELEEKYSTYSPELGLHSHAVCRRPGARSSSSLETPMQFLFG